MTAPPCAWPGSGGRTILQDRTEPQDTQEVSRALLRGCVGKPSLPSELESFPGSFPPAAPAHSGRLLVRIPPRLQGPLEGPGHGETGLKSHTAQEAAWERRLGHAQRWGGREPSQPPRGDRPRATARPVEQVPAPKHARGLLTSWCCRPCPEGSPPAESRSRARR